MEFTELADYPLPAGRITEWTPVLPDNSWSSDPRPITHIHDDYCHRIRAQGDRPAAWLGTVFEISMALDPSCLRLALSTWMNRHEVFKTTVREKYDSSAGDYVYERITHFGNGIDIVDLDIGLVRTGAEVYQRLLNFFETGLSPLLWPHCLAATVTVDSDPERFLFVFAADHSVMDAYSLLISIHEIRRLYEAALAGQALILPEVGSHVDFSAVDRALGNGLRAEHPAVRQWSEFLAVDGGKLPPFPLPLHDPATQGSIPDSAEHQSGLSARTLNAEQSDRLGTRSRAAGCGAQTAILAAIADTTRILTGSTTSRFVMPMHTRTEPSHAEAIGWFVGLIPVHIDIAGVTTPNGILSAVADSIARTRHLAAIPFPQVLKILDSEAVPQFVVNYVDLRFVPDAEHWTQWRARTLRSSTSSCDEVYLWIVRSPAGLVLSSRFPSTPTATANAHSFINTFNSVIAHYTDTGEFSPCEHPAAISLQEMRADGFTDLPAHENDHLFARSDISR